MERRILGKTGLAVSPICIGAWQLGGPLTLDGQPDGHPDPGRDAVLRLIRTLGDAGINFIDTAEQYGNGESERRVGEALRGQRERWVISTKFGYRVSPDGRRSNSSSPATITPSLEQSLKRLGTDFVDIYLYHCAPVVSEMDEGRAVLERLVRQGKCRFYGISTGSLALVQTMIDHDMLQVLQYPSSMLDEAAEIRDLAARHSVGTQVRGVLAQGRLSGKYFHSLPCWRSDDNRSRAGGDDFRRYAVLESLVPEGYTMAQVALRWILDDPANHSICLGAKNLQDYMVAIDALRLSPLSAESRSRLAGAVKALASCPGAGASGGESVHQAGPRGKG